MANQLIVKPETTVDEQSDGLLPPVFRDRDSMGRQYEVAFDSRPITEGVEEFAAKTEAHGHLSAIEPKYNTEALSLMLHGFFVWKDDAEKAGYTVNDPTIQWVKPGNFGKEQYLVLRAVAKRKPIATPQCEDGKDAR